MSSILGWVWHVERIEKTRPAHKVWLANLREGGKRETKLMGSYYQNGSYINKLQGCDRLEWFRTGSNGGLS